MAGEGKTVGPGRGCRQGDERRGRMGVSRGLTLGGGCRQLPPSFPGLAHGSKGFSFLSQLPGSNLGLPT